MSDIYIPNNPRKKEENDHCDNCGEILSAKSIQFRKCEFCNKEFEIKEKSPTAYSIDPAAVTPEQQMRIENWSRDVMRKNEYKLNRKKYKHRQLVASGTVSPESIDMQHIYNFKDLNWIIYRHIDTTQDLWVLMLRAKGQVLCQAGFAKIDSKG